jgi:hypothetical protein
VNLATLLAFLAAHPGHGHTDPESWTHYLTEPAHVIPLALAVGSIVAVGWFGRRLLARSRR